MKTFAMFAVMLTMMLIVFVLCMLAIAGFCYVMKRIEKKRGLSPRMAKWVYILDWLGEEKE